jgi:hypothetical protein
LENERIAVGEVIWTDPFLSQHCEALLYEFAPASPAKALNELIDLNVLERQGKGRATKYVMKTAK